MDTFLTASHARSQQRSRVLDGPGRGCTACQGGREPTGPGRAAHRYGAKSLWWCERLASSTPLLLMDTSMRTSCVSPLLLWRTCAPGRGGQGRVAPWGDGASGTTMTRGRGPGAPRWWRHRTASSQAWVGSAVTQHDALSRLTIHPPSPGHQALPARLQPGPRTLTNRSPGSTASNATPPDHDQPVSWMRSCSLRGSRLSAQCTGQRSPGARERWYEVPACVRACARVRGAGFGGMSVLRRQQTDTKRRGGPALQHPPRDPHHGKTLPICRTWIAATRPLCTT